MDSKRHGKIFPRPKEKEEINMTTIKQEKIRQIILAAKELELDVKDFVALKYPVETSLDELFSDYIRELQQLLEYLK